VKARRANSPEEGWDSVKPLTGNSVYTLAEGKNAIDKKKEDKKEPGDNFMNQTELNKYRAVLEARQSELSLGLRNREDIAIEKTPDALDEVQLAGERELAIRNLDRESNLLRNVRGALMRLADGSYGICLHCEEEIKPKRLEAVPWTKFCITCQEAADRHEFESAEVDELLASAA